MTEHHGKSSHHHDHAHSHKTPVQRHGKWFVLAVVLMIAGMAIYVMTMEEEIEPGGGQPRVPAEAPAE
jgi:hypothetical protein